MFRDHQINRNAIRDRYCQQCARRGGDPTVDTIDVDPAPAAVERHHLDPMHLIGQRDCRELQHLPSEGKPATHHLAHRLLAPETKIKARTKLRPSARNAGYNSETLTPCRNFEPGDSARHGYFVDCPRGIDVTRGERRMRCAARSTPLTCCPLARLLGAGSAVPPTTHPPARSRPPVPAVVRRSVRNRARFDRRYEWCWDPPPPVRRGAWPCRPGYPGTRRCHP